MSTLINQVIQVISNNISLVEYKIMSIMILFKLYIFFHFRLENDKDVDA